MAELCEAVHAVKIVRVSTEGIFTPPQGQGFRIWDKGAGLGWTADILVRSFSSIRQT